MQEAIQPLISVVVPVFNIKECIEYCLQSLLNQRCDNEYEILCIDDGSTDGSGLLLDAAAEKSDKVKVLHKENGGLSDARNYGVKNAAGSYITFVDGDDIVSPYYISSLSAGLSFGDDVTVVGTHRLIKSSDDIDTISWGPGGTPKPIDKVDLLRGICFQKILSSACFRLAKRDLYLDHPFPKGVVYEDTFITVEHLEASSQIVFIDEPIYGYVSRANSIVNSKKERLSRCRQHSDAIDRFCDLASLYLPFDSDEQVTFRSIEYSRLWRHLDMVIDEPSGAKSIQVDIRRYIENHLRQLCLCPFVSKGNKARFILLAKAPHFYRKFFQLYDRLVKGITL